MFDPSFFLQQCWPPPSLFDSTNLPKLFGGAPFPVNGSLKLPPNFNIPPGIAPQFLLPNFNGQQFLAAMGLLSGEGASVKHEADSNEKKKDD
jgi:hypothetical protein